MQQHRHTDEDENIPNNLQSNAPLRNRVNSSPTQPYIPPSIYPNAPPSAGPYKTNFGSNGLPLSPFRSSFGHNRSHSRTGSMSGSFAPPLPSPLSGSFPSNISHSHSHNGISSFSTPNSNNNELIVPTSNPSDLSNGTPSSKPNSRRHTRLHSRNLSVFFPRPGSLPESSILEDGAQEIQLEAEAPVVDMPSASPGFVAGATPYSAHKEKLQGFTFGGKPTSGSLAPPGSAPASGTSRRGHHHKHSMSHNFFSFLEPGSQTDPSDLHTQPTPVPVSPWNPISPFPESAAPTKPTFGRQIVHDHSHEHGHEDDNRTHDNTISHYESSGGLHTKPLAVTATLGQFLLGAWLWVSGQQIGSLSCTGLGYWVVFDSFGIALNILLPTYLAQKSMRSNFRRPYGNARIETVAMFAQSVYLMFSSVYVCKETVEHLLLSVGEGHHHHHGDEEPTTLGIEFPVFLILFTLLSLISTALYFNNHAKLVDTAGYYIPPIRSIIRDTFSRYPTVDKGHHLKPTSPTEIILSNPFVLSPILFCASILLAEGFMPLTHYRIFDLVLAAVETVVTFNVAYGASTVLGTVLLQTSPARGLSGGRMEAFLRAMKEVERHPQIVHLPAPHIWQLTPSLASRSGSPSQTNNGPPQSLIVTMELHVRKDLADDDVLELTRWAWERCVSALDFGTGREEGERSEAEVTVGVVRG